jgi:serine/threonine protein kinase
MTDRASAAPSKASTPDTLIGRVIADRFKITALIARGGMGKVYRAEQAPLGRICAVKVLNPNYAGEHDPEFHKRFFLEASVASKLTHPNTVTIFDYGKTDDDVYFMAMEYLEGSTLHRAIREAGHFPEERVAHIGRQICRALREAHSLGVIHRDLKPANIFLVEHGDESDFVKVLDFGLVKQVGREGEDLTQTGLFMGSPKYMSPEQIRGDRVDARTDVYALGIIMYEMLTGKVPFDRPNSVNILMAHVNEDAPSLRQTNPNITVTPMMEETVARCMAKDPEQRFRSMDEVLVALKRVGGGSLTQTISGVSAGVPPDNRPSGSLPLPTFTGSTGSGGFAKTQSDPGSLPAMLALPSDSPPPGGNLASQAPGKNGSKGVLIAAVIGALALAGVMSYVALSSGRPAANGTTTPATSGGPKSTVGPTATTPAPSAVPTVQPPAQVTVRINTDPDGATVKEDGVELCNSTPCDVVYKGGDADATKEHKLVVAHQGYRAESRTIKVGDTPVTMKLTKADGPRWVAPPQTKPDNPPPVPTGYKTDIPY